MCHAHLRPYLSKQHRWTWAFPRAELPPGSHTARGKSSFFNIWMIKAKAAWSELACMFAGGHTDRIHTEFLVPTVREHLKPFQAFTFTVCWDRRRRRRQSHWQRRNSGGDTVRHPMSTLWRKPRERLNQHQNRGDLYYLQLITGLGVIPTLARVHHGKQPTSRICSAKHMQVESLQPE